VRSGKIGANIMSEKYATQWGWLSNEALSRFLKRRRERADECRAELREANARLKEIQAEIARRRKADTIDTTHTSISDRT
jgi:hypothetical protein